MTDNFPRAGFLRRLGSWLYDSLLSIAVYMAAGALSFIIFAVLFDYGFIDNQGYEHAIDLKTNSWFYSLIINSFSLFWVAFFFIYFWARSGQTIGMRAWRLRVQTQSGNLISKTTGCKRLIPTLLGLGNLWLLVDNKNKLSLQDKLTNTEVVVLSLKVNKGANWSNG